MTAVSSFSSYFEHQNLLVILRVFIYEYLKSADGGYAAGRAGEEARALAAHE